MAELQSAAETAAESAPPPHFKHDSHYPQPEAPQHLVEFTQRALSPCSQQDATSGWPRLTLSGNARSRIGTPERDPSSLFKLHTTHTHIYSCARAGSAPAHSSFSAHKPQRAGAVRRLSVEKFPRFPLSCEPGRRLSLPSAPPATEWQELCSEDRGSAPEGGGISAVATGQLSAPKGLSDFRTARAFSQAVLHLGLQWRHAGRLRPAPHPFITSSPAGSWQSDTKLNAPIPFITMEIVEDRFPCVLSQRQQLDSSILSPL
ncbi:uncharacterized protein LOC113456329 [Microtus ochrogaster]|uniref:Uncharacterized protein LOC113456329 n=1 Tax=Microtus ochrogaster TaxID=79684 RepID=A0ABM1U3C7_MICOH|nr:uncharacterized protein LOC113456329 [Microtus ochrogaster]